ncbi:D-alanine--D-alanine ligase [Phenylobacterium sp.]|uniref:D-alanine--D-alanine ligase family protein n=1 Tax=Phenylobacterium sp. TaxID=1871053 RepID=UPI0035AF6AAB
MKPTILFGGTNRERLVSVASAQAIIAALPQADLWFWTPDGRVRTAARSALIAHQRPFEIDFPAGEGEDLGPIEAALDRSVAERRVLVLALHGGAAESGEFAALAEARGVAFTGSGAAASRLAFDKAAAKRAVVGAGVAVAGEVALDAASEGLARYGRLVAKPVAEGSSYGLLFIDDAEGLARLAQAAACEAYLIEPFVAGQEATCGVLETDGGLIALPPVEILPGGGAFDYASKYLSAQTREICPATFAPEVNAALQASALDAHRAVGAAGYSRSDFIVTPHGLIFLEINTLPGLTPASLYPKTLAAQGVAFDAFLKGQVALAERRARQ